MEATMQLGHIDRSPLGDVAGTVSSLVCTNPQLSLRLRLVTDGQETVICSADVAGAGPVAGARRMAAKVKAASAKAWPAPI